MRELARLLFGLNRPVSQRAYIAVGFGLMLLKYGVDAILIRYATGEVWTPLDYLSPLFEGRGRKLATAPPWFTLAMALWTLPFLWIGVGMSMRRAMDAGRSGWIGLLFFVPFVNYVMMFALCTLPRSEGAGFETRTVIARSVPQVDDRLSSALLTFLAGVGLVTGLLLFSVYVNERYGPFLFLAVPFVLGVFSAVVYNHQTFKSYGGTVLVAVTSVAISAGTLLLFALEGIVCLAMALPLAIPLTLGGATLGYALVSARRPQPTELGGVLLALFLLASFEERLTGIETFEVVTTVEIDATPEQVWPNVVSFSELPPPQHWLFRTGVAFPVRARIEGRGVGAIRHCEFSTGAFVEPITAWDEPHRLSFDVTRQPDPMEEWSFYGNLEPPHLDRSFRSLRGEFRLVPLPGGRTRLEGSTWYTLDIHPSSYWRWLSEPLLHTIHRRVLSHVKDLSENRPR